MSASENELLPSNTYGPKETQNIMTQLRIRSYTERKNRYSINVTDDISY